MDCLKRPFIFAYSAHIDESVIKKTEEAGFDGYIESKLGPESLAKIIHNYIETFVESIIDQKMMKHQRADKMKEIIRDIDLNQSINLEVNVHQLQEV